MRRIISFDVMRGLSMLVMIAFHVLTHVLYISVASLDDIPLEIIIVGGIMFLFGNFRSAFLIISSAVNMVSMQRNLEKGMKPIRIWAKQMFFGVVIILIAMVGQGFFDTWGILGQSYANAGTSLFDPNWDWNWVWSWYARLNYIESVHTIGWSIILTSTIHLFLTIGKKHHKIIRNMIIYGFVGIFVLTLTPFLKIWIENFWGGPITGWGGTQYSFIGWNSWEGWGDAILRILSATAVGDIEPLFPYFASACFGSVLGLALTSKKPSRKIPNWGMIIGLVSILIGGGIFLIDTSQFMVLIAKQVFIHPVWFFLIVNGLEMIIICFILRIREFNPRVDLDKYAKRTTYLRRWGLIALTLFTFQLWPEFFMRDLFTWMTTIDYHGRRKNTLYATILMMLLVVTFWDLIIRLWERIEFVGSLEWVMSLVSTRMLRKNGKNKQREKLKAGRMQIKSILYKPDCVRYV